MKKLLVVMLVAALVIVWVGLTQAELRPVVKVMLMRLNIMQTIVKDLAVSDFDAVKKSADEMAAHAQKSAEGAEGARKDYTVKLAAAAKALSDAAAKKDAGAVVKGYGDTIVACYACHAALRDPVTPPAK